MSQIAALRFLVVEDHVFQRWLIGSLLEGLGAKSVQLVENGSAALRILSRPDREVDIVVSDLDMPEMDGMRLIRLIGERRLPVALIVVSALHSPLLATVEAMAREYGVTFLAAIEKPLTARKLLAALEKHRVPAPAPESRDAAPAFSSAEIADALKRGEFEPHFQPEVDMATGRVRGAEALARWRHPTLGSIGPHSFMGTVESQGLIGELTTFMVREAATHCRAWNILGLDLSVSINLSPLSLGDASLADRLAGLVDAAGLKPRQVIFEITETAATSDLGAKLENLTRLRMKGFSLSIDDYGTGYSSMHRLVQVPFTELKIDQAFVRKAVKDPASRAMVESSLDIAARLGLAVVAEGVEERAQWDLLRTLGCTFAQGFLVAPPMPAAEFADWVRSRHPPAASAMSCEN